MKENTELKKILGNEILPRLAGEYKYFNLDAVRNSLKKRNLNPKPETLTKYLYGFRKEGIIFDSGYCWFSSIPDSFEPNTEPVSEITLLLEKKFPLLEFLTWSTEQIKGHVHHTLSHFVTFLYLEKYDINPVAEFLRDSGYAVYKNPRGKERDDFTMRGKTIVIRPRIVAQPRKDHFASAEGILVDLFVEIKNLPLMDKGEYYLLFENLVTFNRIYMAKLISYAEERKPATDMLLRVLKSAFSGFIKYS